MKYLVEFTIDHRHSAGGTQARWGERIFIPDAPDEREAEHMARNLLKLPRGYVVNSAVVHERLLNEVH